MEVTTEIGPHLAGNRLCARREVANFHCWLTYPARPMEVDSHWEVTAVARGWVEAQRGFNVLASGRPGRSSVAFMVPLPGGVRHRARSALLPLLLSMAAEMDMANCGYVASLPR